MFSNNERIHKSMISHPALERLYQEWLLSKDSDMDIPNVQGFFASLNIFHLILLFSAILPCIIVIALGIFHAYFYKTNTTNEEVRSALYFVIAMPPITVMGSIVGMVIPRAAGFLYAVTTTYYMLALYMMVDLMFTMFCGKRALARYLQEDTKVIDPDNDEINSYIFEGPPRENLLRIEALIIQTVFVRALMQICELVVYFELRRKSNIFFMMTNIITVISMNISQWSGHALVDTVKEILETYGFGLMFDLQDLLISVPTLQKMVLDLAVFLGFIKPLNLIPDSSLAMFYLNVMMIWQCLVVSLYATYVFRPSNTSLLDVANVDDLIMRKTPSKVRMGTLEMTQEGSWMEAKDEVDVEPHN